MFPPAQARAGALSSPSHATFISGFTPCHCLIAGAPPSDTRTPSEILQPIPWPQDGDLHLTHCLPSSLSSET